MTRATIAVIAKAPVAGFVKTRLCPPCTPQQAAEIAEAALAMTCAAIADVPGVRRVAVLDGTPGPWLPSGFDVVPQVRGGLGERLTAAYDELGPHTLIIGMDTPQVTPAHFERCLAALRRHDACFGPADDGGYWIVGQRGVDPHLFDNVTMSVEHTLTEQLAQAERRGRTYALTDTLVDIDSIDDLRCVVEGLRGSLVDAACAGVADLAGAASRR